MKIRQRVLLTGTLFFCTAASLLWQEANTTTAQLSSDELALHVGQQKKDPCPKCGGNVQMVCSGCAEPEIKCAMGIRKYSVKAKSVLKRLEGEEEWEVPDGCAIRKDPENPANTWTDPCPPKNWQNERGTGNSSPGATPLNCGTHEVHACTEGPEKETKLALGAKLKEILNAVWHIVHTRPCLKGEVVEEPDCRPGNTTQVLVSCKGQR